MAVLHRLEGSRAIMPLALLSASKGAVDPLPKKTLPLR